MASRSSSILMRRSSGPTQSGWRLAERWSMPGGSVRMEATRSFTFCPEQQAASARLGSLPDDDLDGIGLAQIGRVEAVARGKHLVHQERGGLALLGRHAAVARRGRRADFGGRPTQGLLGPRRQRAEAHAGDGDGDVQLERRRTVATAEHRLRLAALPVALQRVPGDGGRQEDEVVEGRELAAGAEATDGVVTRFGHVVDTGDDVGREAGVGRDALEGLARHQ